MNFEPFFEQYLALVKQVDAAFDRVKNEYAECVRCKERCADCCHALFDITLIEALYIRKEVAKRFEGASLEELLERANRADRDIHRLKRKAVKELEKGRTEPEILEEMALKRVRCPALNDDERCAIYEVRPITCRVYGIPTEIGGRAHTCGISGFQEGRSYPTLKLDAVYQRLYGISAELADAIKSRYPKLAEMLVPLSMALLTDYTEEYLGVGAKPEDEGPEKKQGAS